MPRCPSERAGGLPCRGGPSAVHHPPRTNAGRGCTGYRHGCAQAVEPHRAIWCVAVFHLRHACRARPDAAQQHQGAGGVGLPWPHPASNRRQCRADDRAWHPEALLMSSAAGWANRNTATVTPFTGFDQFTQAETWGTPYTIACTWTGQSETVNVTAANGSMQEYQAKNRSEEHTS